MLVVSDGDGGENPLSVSLYKEWSSLSEEIVTTAI